MPRKKKKQESFDELDVFLSRFNLVSNLERKKHPTKLLPLDYVLGGGVAEGSIMELYGPEFSGKTTLALYIAAALHKQIPDKKILYIDAEHALNIDWACKIGLCDIGPSKEHDVILIQPMSANEAMDAVVEGTRTGRFSVVILDSLPALMAEEEISAKVKETDVLRTDGIVRGVLPKLVTTMVRRLTAVLNDTIVIWINQVRANMNPWGAQHTTPGGYARQHAAHYRIEMKKHSPKDSKTTIGIKAVKNKHGIPYLESQFVITSAGIDVHLSNVEFLVEAGIIEKAQAIYKFGEHRVRGKDNFAKLMKEDEKLYEQLLDAAYKYIQKVHEGRVTSKEPEVEFVTTDSELAEAVEEALATDESEEVFADESEEIFEEAPLEEAEEEAFIEEVIEEDTEDGDRL